MTITSKLPDVGTSIFTVMSALAAEHGAINLSQGFPDFDTPPVMVDRVLAHMRAGRNQYAPMQGVALLRERIAEKTADLYGNPVDPDTEITVTSGATEALFAAITAVVRPGDEVVVFEPAFDSYVPVIRLNGGIPVYLSMKTPDYCIDWDEVSDAIGPNTRLIIITSPHNPMGTVLSPADVAALKQIVADASLYLELSAFYQKKRDRFLSLLENSRFKPLPCHGTYFQMMDYSAISDLDDVAFARRMTTVHKVAAIQPSEFYHDGQDNRVLRFCFAKRDQTLEQTAEILCRI